MDSTTRKRIDAMLHRKNGSILITDSGLGGLSICARVVSMLGLRGLFQRVSVVYFNAWPEQHRGYNKIFPVTERIRVFDRALIGMQAHRPDLIMIACNTLSALYDRTEFSRNTPIPAVGIIDFGVDQIHASLRKNPAGKVLILGTLTTINENRHKQMLIARGVSESRILTQQCDGLATAIEKGPEGDAAAGLVDRYLREAAARIEPGVGKLFVALCCTHFGYCAGMIKKKTEELITPGVEILNPNRLMANYLFEADHGRNDLKTQVDVRVVSRIRIAAVTIDSISSLIRGDSPETAEALAKYEYNPDLFTF